MAWTCLNPDYANKYKLRRDTRDFNHVDSPLKPRRWPTEIQVRVNSTQWAHDVVATLNQRHWRWFNVATTSCAQWVVSTCRVCWNISVSRHDPFLKYIYLIKHKETTTSLVDIRARGVDRNADPANTRRSGNVGTMLGQRRRWWASIVPTWT